MSIWNSKSEFPNGSAFRSFQQRIETAIVSGEASEVHVDPNYGRAMIYGGRWICKAESGEVWRLVEPQEPFMGLWEPVLIAGLNPAGLNKPAPVRVSRGSVPEAGPRSVRDRDKPDSV